MTAEIAIGVDVGATKIAGALVTIDGKVEGEERTATGAADGPLAIVSRITDVVQSLKNTATGPVAGIGIGTPGYVDPIEGVVRNAVNLGWQEIDLVTQVRRRLETEIGVWVDNDANVQALGEYYYGAAKNCGNCVYMGIGSGFGSGIILHGHLVSGASFTAAELGHLSLDPDGRQCACGLRGCVETIVSGPGILASARERLAAGESSSLDYRQRLTPERVLQAAQDGDAMACAVFAETARSLGAVFATCVAVLNPARIIIGGGMGHASYELLVPGALDELRRRVPSETCADLVVVPSQVTSSAAGASSLVWHERSR